MQLKFNSDYLANSCLIVYRMGGVPQILHYLYDILRQSIPLARINAIFCTLDGRAIINMGDTRKTTIPNKYNAPLVERGKIEEPLIIDNLEPYKTPQLLQDPLHNDVPFLQHASLLRLPLLRIGNSMFVINFWSDETGVFEDEQVPQLHKALEPLKEELLASLSGIAMRSDIDRANQRMNGTEKVCLCPGLAPVRALVEQAAKVDTPALIMGETGVGKESVADMIYEISPRRVGPIVKINCGAIAENLLDSEFFGHEKGAFTGAIAARPGYFEMADCGVLFLDEIGEMPLVAQTRLLRVLDNGVVCRVGGRKFFPVNARVIAATNADLPGMVARGQFRKDLWYRLSALIIEVPPLRDRKEDLAPLLAYFLRQKTVQLGLPFIKGISDSEMHALYRYDWPGNVRELEHVVERAMLANMLAGTDRPPHFEMPLCGRAAAPVRAGTSHPLQHWPTLREHEDQYIREVLEHCGGKLTGPGSATALLGIHYNTLKARLEKMGIRAVSE